MIAVDATLMNTPKRHASIKQSTTSPVEINPTDPRRTVVVVTSLEFYVHDSAFHRTNCRLAGRNASNQEFLLKRKYRPMKHPINPARMDTVANITPNASSPSPSPLNTPSLIFRAITPNVGIAYASQVNNVFPPCQVSRPHRTGAMTNSQKFN